MLSTFADKYRIKMDFRKGEFGSIFCACSLRSNKREFVVKIYDLGMIQEKKIHRETAISASLHHPNIIHLEDSFYELPYQYLVFDRLNGRDLFDEIKSRGSIPESESKSLFLQLIEAVDYMHDRRIVHRDIKPENIVLHKEGNETILKLTNFGLAISLRSSDPEECWYGFAGTAGYLSPEMLRKDAYGTPTDIWACGVTLYTMLSGTHAFYHEDYHELYTLIKNGDYEYPPEHWENVSAEAKNLIDSMLENTPKKRINAKELLDCKWMNEPFVQVDAGIIGVEELKDEMKKIDKTKKSGHNPHSALFFESKEEKEKEEEEEEEIQIEEIGSSEDSSDSEWMMVEEEKKKKEKKVTKKRSKRMEKEEMKEMERKIISAERAVVYHASRMVTRKEKLESEKSGMMKEKTGDGRIKRQEAIQRLQELESKDRSHLSHLMRELRITKAKAKISLIASRMQPKK